MDYLADRLVNLIRTQPLEEQQETHVSAGMLQGFITVTTFTNWQPTICWDSRHELAFSFDEPAMEQEREAGLRKLDSDGSLASALQATVHCGDVWNEGIVWPRIAENYVARCLGMWTGT